MRIGFFVLTLPVFLTGCAFGPKAAPSSATALAINGNVHGGQQPVSGAHVYLYAANTTGYGKPSVSLLEPADNTVSDSDGNYYVTTDTSGGFTITGDYACTQGQQVYLYAQGGDPGSGPNSSAGLLAVLGNCPGGTFATEVPFVEVNEVTTVATAYALAGFATDPTHVADDEAVVSNPTAALAKTGMANAFANASNLADISSGIARSMTLSGSGIVPQATIDTLANILAACINSNGAVTGPDSPTACYTLLNNAPSGGTSGTVPADTAAAAINIAHNPALNVAALYGLASSHPPFAPSLTAVPNDFSLGLVFTGGGLGGTNAMAVDATGNIWITGNGDPKMNEGYSVIEISSAGVFLSGPNGYLSRQQGYPGGLFGGAGPIAVDTLRNIWIGNGGNSGVGSLWELSPNGTVLSTTGGVTSTPNTTNNGLYPYGLAIDANNNLWVADRYTSRVDEFSNLGVLLSGTSGFTGGGISEPHQLAISPSGNVWVANANNTFSELSSSGAPLTSSAGTPIPAASLAIDHQGNVWALATTASAQVSKVSPSGAILSGSGFSVPGLVGSSDDNGTIVIDGDGNAWLPVDNNPSIAELSNSGVLLSGANGYLSGVGESPGYIVLDGSGDLWFASATLIPSTERGVPATYIWMITEMVGIAAPVVTPIAVGVQLNMLGARP